jgi:ATP adenylyltransferase
MKHLWSPWRSVHVSKHDEAEERTRRKDLFYTIGADVERDAENFVLWRRTAVYVVMNLYPYNTGHVMVIPYTPYAFLDELPVEVSRELFDTAHTMSGLLRRTLGCTGINLGLNTGAGAGAGIPEHLHCHIVPRWEADTNFLTATAHTRVLPEGLDVTYTRLQEAIADHVGRDG